MDKRGSNSTRKRPKPVTKAVDGPAERAGVVADKRNRNMHFERVALGGPFFCLTSENSLNSEMSNVVLTDRALQANAIDRAADVEIAMPLPTFLEKRSRYE